MVKTIKNDETAVISVSCKLLSWRVFHCLNPVIFCIKPGISYAIGLHAEACVPKYQISS